MICSKDRLKYFLNKLHSLLINNNKTWENCSLVIIPQIQF
jgi:hypothetical protein